MGLGKRNPGCKCDCCAPCPDLDLPWYISYCDWTSDQVVPRKMIPYFKGVVFDLGYLDMQELEASEYTGHLASWPMERRPLIYGEARLPISIPSEDRIVDLIATIPNSNTSFIFKLLLEDLEWVLAVFYEPNDQPCVRNIDLRLAYVGTILSGTQYTNSNSFPVSLATVSPLVFDARVSSPVYLPGFMGSPAPTWERRYPCDYYGAANPRLFTHQPIFNQITINGSVWGLNQDLFQFSISGLQVGRNGGGMNVRHDAIFPSCCTPPPGTSLGTFTVPQETFESGQSVQVTLSGIHSWSVTMVESPAGWLYDDQLQRIVIPENTTDGVYTVLLRGQSSVGTYAGCVVSSTVTVTVGEVYQCPVLNDFTELEASVTPNFPDQPRVFSKSGSMTNFAKFVLTNCDPVTASIEGLPAGLTRGEEGIWNDSNLWFVGTPMGFVYNGIHTITIKSTVTSGPHAGCEIGLEYHILVTD